MIAIVDYQMGNLRSVQKGFEKVGHEATVTSNPDVIARCQKVVLPGVGAFADAMEELRRRHLVEPLQMAVAQGKPLLGICLGLQLLFDVSYEDGQHEGLGLVPGKIIRFEPRPGLKIPHMGWNAVSIRRPAPIFTDLPSDSYFYFVHSYYAVAADTDVVAGETPYPDPFCSVVWRDNVYATQFHPEKSQRDGLRILANFASLD